MRDHRIKKINLDLVSKALKNLGIEFELVDCPLSDNQYNYLDGQNGDQWNNVLDELNQENSNMIGIRCNLSGQKFHNLLKDCGIV